MNFIDFHFIRPFWLLALIPYIFLMVLSWKNKLMQGHWSQVCDAELLPYILQERATTQNRLPLVSAAIAGLITIIALAGPTWERLPSPVFRNASALVIALDLSRSMEAADIKPSRLIRAKYKIADILKQRKDGQTALIVYAGDSFTVTPLTEDTDTIISQLEALGTEIMPAQGSNAVSALQQAQALFKQAGLTRGEILWVTDGAVIEDTLPSVKALDNYKLSILAVGTKQGAPIKIPQGGFLKDVAGNIVVPKLNIQDLQQLANFGGGSMRLISTDDSDIKVLLTRLDGQVMQNKTEDNDVLLDLWQDQGPWLLLLVLPLAALCFRRGLLCLVIFIILPMPKTSYALDWQDFWKTKDQQAQKNFKQQNFGQAAEQFNNPEWKAAAQYKAGEFTQAAESLQSIQTSDALYNRGNALAKSGQLQEAIKAYQQALEIDPKHQDALHNKELVEKQLQKQQEEKKQQGENESQEQDSQQDQQKQESDQQSQDQENSEPSQEQQSQQEQSKQNESSDDQESQPQDQQKDADKPENEQQQAEQKQDETNDQQANEEESRALTEQAMEQNETEQANEQWLQRIPDDPSGLLRRKFMQQYRQRKSKAETTQAW